MGIEFEQTGTMNGAPAYAVYAYGRLFGSVAYFKGDGWRFFDDRIGPPHGLLFASFAEIKEWAPRAWLRASTERVYRKVTLG